MNVGKVEEYIGNINHVLLQNDSLIEFQEKFKNKIQSLYNIDSFLEVYMKFNSKNDGKKITEEKLLKDIFSNFKLGGFVHVLEEIAKDEDFVKYLVEQIIPSKTSTKFFNIEKEDSPDKELCIYKWKLQKTMSIQKNAPQIM